MSTTKNNALIISEHDYQTLVPLIEKHKTSAAEALENELGRAEIIDDADFPENVVAMDSSVTFKDLDSGDESTVSLVYPTGANIEEMKISILSPVGTALIGLRVGGKIDWPLPGGRIRHLQVMAVTQTKKAMHAV
ncbi:MAG: nucleoside diphosphate kinase regulator [Pseudomonadota bacterium]